MTKAETCQSVVIQGSLGFKAVHGYARLCMAVYGCVRLCMAVQGCVGLCLSSSKLRGCGLALATFCQSSINCTVNLYSSSS